MQNSKRDNSRWNGVLIRQELEKLIDLLSELNLFILRGGSQVKY